MPPVNVASVSFMAFGFVFLIAITIWDAYRASKNPTWEDEELPPTEPDFHI